MNSSTVISLYVQALLNPEDWQVCNPNIWNPLYYNDKVQCDMEWRDFLTTLRNIASSKMPCQEFIFNPKVKPFQPGKPLAPIQYPQ